MKNIICWSGGKDSTATIILAHEHNIKIDEIIFCEVMYNQDISGELPEHIDFIKNKAIPKIEKWGYKVKVLHSDLTYEDMFYKINHSKKHPERNGKKYGFPMAGRCIINDRCKMRPIRKYVKDLGEHIGYIGIAIDDPKRLERLTDNKISLLAKYNYTEEMAKELCIKNDLLSPTYNFVNRGGCWFCPNAKRNELKLLYTKHKDLMELLVKKESEKDLIGNMWNILIKKRITDIYNEFNQSTLFDFMEEK